MNPEESLPTIEGDNSHLENTQLVTSQLEAQNLPELEKPEGDIVTQKVETSLPTISSGMDYDTPNNKPMPVDVNAVSPTQEIRVDSETKPLSPLSPEKQQLLNNVDTLASMDPKTTPTEKILGFLRKLRGK